MGFGPHRAKCAPGGRQDLGFRRSARQRHLCATEEKAIELIFAEKGDAITPAGLDLEQNDRSVHSNAAHAEHCGAR
jgi:hypothetical protein